MEVLNVPQDTRTLWIDVISDLAKEKIDNPYLFARGVENEAYIRRQVKIDVADGVAVYRYGDIDVLDIDSQGAHTSAAFMFYTKMLRRVAWALHGSKSMSSQDPKAWLDASDDLLVEGTVHAEWERKFYAQQDLSRDVLSGKGSTATKGIFACTRCKSFDVDTEQKQTRSADEPMTIFCTCNVCGKRFVR